MVGAKRGRIAAGLFAVALMVLSSCGGSSDSRDRNAMSLIGTTCKKPGTIKKVGGVSFVCGHIKRAKPKEGLYYGVAAVKNWICAKPGATRYQNGIFSVCSGGSKAKSRKWALTVPMPVAVSAIIEKEETSSPGALETIGVPIPDGLVNIPGAVGPLVGASTTTLAQPTSSTSRTDAPATTGASGETTTTGSPDTQTTAVQPQGLNTTTLPADSTTVTTAGPTSTLESTTIASTVAPSSSQILSPTTVSQTTVVSTTSVASTTTEPATTTSASTTTPTTTEASTTTAAPESPKTCAEGGRCVPGDTGPGGGQVFEANFDLGKPPALVEVAPVTWFVKGTLAQDFVTRLRYGGKVNWRLPTEMELMALRRDRLQFRCPKSKRCAKGFSNSPYWASGESGLFTVDFAGIMGPVVAQGTESHYVRPVRTINNALPVLEIAPG